MDMGASRWPRRVVRPERPTDTAWATRREGPRGEPGHPRPAAQAAAMQTRATTHSRTVQARRQPRPTRRAGAAATTNAQPRGTPPMGPTWKRSRAPKPGAWAGLGAAPARLAHSRPG